MTYLTFFSCGEHDPDCGRGRAEGLCFVSGALPGCLGVKDGGEVSRGGGDAASAEAPAARAASAAAIGEQGLRRVAWPAASRSVDRARRRQGLERGLLVTLAGGQDEVDGPPAPLAAQMELRAEVMIGGSRSSVGADAAVGSWPRGRASEHLPLLPHLARAA